MRAQLLDSISLVVALLVTLGAVPLGNRLTARFRTNQDRFESWVGTGFVAAYLGVLLAGFYVLAMPTVARTLAIGIAGLLALCTWLSIGRSRPIRDEYLPAILLIAMLYLVPVTFPGFAFKAASLPLPIAMLLFVLVLTPLALRRIGLQYHNDAPARTINLSVMIVFGLLALTTQMPSTSLGAPFAMNTNGQTLLHVFAPVVGSLAACVYYMAQTRWRDAPVIRMGQGGYLALGVFISWSAGIVVADAVNTTLVISTIWVVCLPLFDAIRERLRLWLIRTQLLVRLAPRFHDRLHPISPLLSYLAAVLLIGTGVCGHWMNWPPLLNAGGLLPALILYLLLPVMLSAPSFDTSRHDKSLA